MMAADVEFASSNRPDRQPLTAKLPSAVSYTTVPWNSSSPMLRSALASEDRLRVAKSM